MNRGRIGGAKGWKERKSKKVGILEKKIVKRGEKLEQEATKAREFNTRIMIKVVTDVWIVRVNGDDAKSCNCCEVSKLNRDDGTTRNEHEKEQVLYTYWF